MNENQKKDIIISFMIYRKLIGYLGMALPIVAVLGGFMPQGGIIQESISNYYYTNMRDFFVGILCCVSLFLICYRGYEAIDDIITDISGICALGIAMFPMSLQGSYKVGIFNINDNVSNNFHYAFAALFFLSLAFNSLVLFTKHKGGQMSKEKRMRNFTFRMSGIIILGCLLFLAIYSICLQNTSVSKINPILICETIALFAFGISWLIKGQTVLKDKIIAINN